MKNRDNVPEEIIEVFAETLAEDYKFIFGEEPNIKRLTALVNFFGMEKVQQVMTYLFIKGVDKPKNGQKYNPMGYLFVTCKGFKVK